MITKKEVILAASLTLYIAITFIGSILGFGFARIMLVPFTVMHLGFDLYAVWKLNECRNKVPPETVDDWFIRVFNVDLDNVTVKND